MLKEGIEYIELLNFSLWAVNGYLTERNTRARDPGLKHDVLTVIPKGGSYPEYA